MFYVLHTEVSDFKTEDCLIVQ